ncbi:MAG: aminotransferase class I/II-fold pyridoxal phosphate-dependent enzyme, partial [Deltaproteobacteria bacterium]|nr:aminotransferase class I/II-fold pyridoxal phosphate-dependent enzyme [Deltaproteobacteria bacterium]
MIFPGQEKLSFLMANGAKEVGVELNSLSKPYNMTGWRIGMACGNPNLIAAISKVKENTDSGIFNPI